MKAILCTRPGGPDGLILADLPTPVAGAGGAVVSVKAVGLNFYDTLIIAGTYQTKPPLPFSRGGELAGVIESVGAGVTDLEPGDRVLGYTAFGAAREFAAVSAANLVNLTVDLDSANASSAYAARRSIAAASSISRSVTPPASWVDSVTSTFL